MTAIPAFVVSKLRMPGRGQGRLLQTILALIATVSLSCMELPGQAPSSDGVLFDGEMEYVHVELEEAFTDLDTITVATWVKLNEAAGIQTFMNRGGRGQLFTLYLYNDHVRMLVEYQPGQYRHTSTAPPPADTWIHYAGTYDGETIRLYVNGSEVSATTATGRIPVRSDDLFIGATSPLVNSVNGRMTDVRLYATALSPSQVAEVFAEGEPATGADWRRFTDAELEEWKRSDFPETPDGEEPEYPFANGTLATTDGFRGLWYVNGTSPDGLHKYSGGLGTYPQQHIPIAIYAEAVNKTFFTYGGTRRDRNHLLHMVSAYDHATGKVARPRILLDKMTTDAHDNPTMSIDADGYIWIFSNAHGTARPSYIHRSIEPYSIEGFTKMVTTNFSYSQPWYLPEHGFVFLHTRYSQGRGLFVENSLDGVHWTGLRSVAHIRNGHYQISWPRGSTIGTAFNYHPDSSSPLGSGLNYRTNLYYMESDDGGQTWRNIQGQPLNLPLEEIMNPALAVEYESQLKLVYLKDLQYTADGRPVILYLTSPGWRSGPDNDPRIFSTAEWTGAEWRIRPVTTGDNNYDFASLYIEHDGAWRIIGSTEAGPQTYNTGGEMAMWLSTNQGESWSLVQRLTEDSEYNHTYPRRPLHAHPDFYALWADGDGRALSPSRFYFTTREGAVFRLPFQIDSDDLWVDPELLSPAPPPPPNETNPSGPAAFAIFDSRGFEDNTLYPEGELQAVTDGGSTWLPGSNPATVVTAEPPYNKILRRTRGTSTFDREWLHFPPVAGGILIVEMDVRVSDVSVRTLDFSLMPESGGLQASFLGWGTTPGSLDYYDGGSWVPVAGLDEGWRHYRMVNYLSGAYLNSFDLIVDGELIAEKLRFRHTFTENDRMSRLRINASGPAGEHIDIDNLRIHGYHLAGPQQLPVAVIQEMNTNVSGISILFHTFAGFEYALDYKDSLAEINWTPLATFPGNGGIRIALDPAPSPDRRFYRIRTLAPLE